MVSEVLGGLDFSELIIDDLWLRKALWSFVGVSLMKVYVPNISRLDALAMKIIFNTSCSIVGNAIKCHIITDYTMICIDHLSRCALPQKGPRPLVGISCIHSISICTCGTCVNSLFMKSPACFFLFNKNF